MADPARQLPDYHDHPVRWSLEDWDRIGKAVDHLRAQQHLDLNPTDIIRAGTRRYVDDLLGVQP